MYWGELRTPIWNRPTARASGSRQLGPYALLGLGLNSIPLSSNFWISPGKINRTP